MDILVVEDDPSVRLLVQKILEKRGFNVQLAETAKETNKKVSEQVYDAIILDLGLPDGDGFDVCKQLRSDNITTPVLVLSAEQETDVKVQCLRAGADDYITKPFNTEELIARIEAISRRNNSVLDNRTLSCNELKLDLVERIFKVNDITVYLTNNEFKLLVYLLKNKNQIITQEEIAVNVWDIHFDTQTNYINVYISYLRKKIRKHSENNYIDTVRKKGFILHCN